MSNLIAFVDTETLGLDPDRHAIWEVGLVLYDPEAETVVSEHLWQLKLTGEQLDAGDPIGMDIGGFNQRYYAQTAVPVDVFLEQFIALTEDRTHLAGAVVSFDEERLRRLALSYGFEPDWHYHIIDVEAMALGVIWNDGQTFPLPWKSDDVAAQFGVTITEEDRHTALGDARWALRLYQAIGA